MNTKCALILALLRTLAASSSVCFAADATSAPALTHEQPRPSSALTKPNIVFILADDLGYGDIGCFGQKHIKTPVLDRMCQEGIKLTSHYSGSTVCAPSRYALLTGQHLGRAQTIGQSQELPEGAETLGTVLQKAGYRTACIGKWGLGSKSGLPNKQGFDHFFGFIDQGRAHFYYTDYVWRNDQKVVFKDNPHTHQHYIHDLFIDESLHFIRDNKAKPFFLYLPLTIPHAEMQVPTDSQEPYIKVLGDPEIPPVEAPYALKGYNKARYPRATRAGMISRMDRDIGRIRELLEELKLSKDTLIVFTSDNGPCTAGGQDIKFFDSTRGLRGAKRSLYEGGIRVPALAVWPGKIAPGQVSDQPSVFYDYLPTFAELAGVKLEKPHDGVSLLPTLLGKPQDQKQHEYIFWDYAESGVTSNISALRRGKWKLVVDRKDAPDRPELYDLSMDPAETKNLAAAHPEIVNELLPLMKKWWR